MFKIVGTVGTIISNFGDVFYSKKTEERNAMDMGILRYPDIDR